MAARQNSTIATFIAMLVILTQSLAVTAMAASTEPQAPMEGWPRLFKAGNDTVLAYQPQIESWDEYSVMKGVAAIQITLTD